VLAPSGQKGQRLLPRRRLKSMLGDLRRQATRCRRAIFANTTAQSVVVVIVVMSSLNMSRDGVEPADHTQRNAERA